MKNRLHQECYTRSCRETEELKRRCNKEEDGVTQQKLNNYSMQHDQESRTVSLLRDQIQKLQDRVEFMEDSKIFQYLYSPSSIGSAQVSHQALIPSICKKPSRESRMHRISRKRFLIGNMPDECLRNYIMIQEIWQHHRGFREEKEVRKVGVKNHCSHYLYVAFRWERGKKV